jgi:hypothetical protein
MTPNEAELQDLLNRFETAMQKLESLITQLREVTGTMGLLTLAIRRLQKRGD